MTPAQLHLALNHLPVAGLLFALILLPIALFTRSRDLRITSLGIIIVSAALAIPVYLSGEDTEETLDRLGASESAMKEHEEMAELSFIALEIMGVLALGALFLTRRPAMERPVMALMLLLTLIAAGMIGWTAKLGGEIRHGPELGAAQGAVTGDHEDDD